MKGLALLYTLIGLGFVGTLLSTMYQYPLVPLQPDSAEWSFAWLLTTIGDFYAMSLCLCIIVLSTEATLAGVAWCCGILFLGSGFSCAYMIYRCLCHKSLELAKNGDSTLLQPPPPDMRAIVLFYGLVGVAFVVGLTTTLAQHPLVPFQSDSAEWSFAWLITTCGDYYAGAVCLCGIILATEATLAGVAWSAGIIFLGSAFSCGYIVHRCISIGWLGLKSQQALE